MGHEEKIIANHGFGAYVPCARVRNMHYGRSEKDGFECGDEEAFGGLSVI